MSSIWVQITASHMELAIRVLSLCEVLIGSRRQTKALINQTSW